jgi:hypothetical protein
MSSIGIISIIITRRHFGLNMRYVLKSDLAQIAVGPTTYQLLWGIHQISPTSFCKNSKKLPMSY